MFSLSVRRVAALTLLIVAGAVQPASAQLMYGDPCGCPAPCGPSPMFRNPFDTCCARPACAPVACAPAPQPIAIPQVSYRQVPVTEYRAVKQTVQRPVIETAMVDQPVTEYRTVYENQTAQVPTVQYQNVTEYRTVQRDCGRWVSQQVCRPQVSPCEYDNRPDLFGYINRKFYTARMAVTPKVYTQRQYVPNVQTVQVPYTRQVAIPGTKQVAYQTAKLVPYTTTRKVAVNQVRMVAQEVDVQQPVTVMKTVPVTTTAYAWGYPGQAGTATAFAPYNGVTAFGANNYGATAFPATTAGAGTVIYPRATTTARGPTPAPTPAPAAAPTRSANLPDALGPDADAIKTDTATPPRTSQRSPGTFDDDGSVPMEDRRVRPAALADDESIHVTNKITPRLPTAVRASGWVARHRPVAPVSPTAIPSNAAPTAESFSVAKRGK